MKQCVLTFFNLTGGGGGRKQLQSKRPAGGSCREDACAEVGTSPAHPGSGDT